MASTCGDSGAAKCSIATRTWLRLSASATPMAWTPSWTLSPTRPTLSTSTRRHSRRVAAPPHRTRLAGDAAGRANVMEQGKALQVLPARFSLLEAGTLKAQIQETYELDR